MHFGSGSYELRDDEDGKFALLKDLFTQPNAKKLMYSIDMKAHGNPTLFTKINDLVQQHGLERNIIWGSMNNEQHLMAKQNPNVSMFYGFK